MDLDISDVLREGRSKEKNSIDMAFSLRRFPCPHLRLQQFRRPASVGAVTSSLPLQAAVSAGLSHRREESLDVSNLRSVQDYQ